MTNPVRTPEQRYTDALESKTATCARCVYYHHGEGECRRSAPSPAMGGTMLPVPAEIGGEPFIARWPHVDIEDWCGDFREGDAGEFNGK